MTDANVNLEEPESSVATSVLTRAQRGEQAAWHRLVDAYLPLVYRWCRSRGLQDADVLDVGQEVLRSLCQHLPRFRREQPTDTFRGWLRRITENAITDHFRRNQKEPCGPGGSSAQERLDNLPAAHLEETVPVAGDEELAIVYGPLVEFVRSEFSEQDWSAFHQVVIEDRSPAEVAQTLAITRNQVYLAKSRILRKLREQFRAFGEEPRFAGDQVAPPR